MNRVTGSTGRGIEWLHSDRHVIDDSRMIITVLVSPLAVLLLVGPSVLRIFGSDLVGMVAAVIVWIFTGFVIAVVSVALGAWVLHTKVDP